MIRLRRPPVIQLQEERFVPKCSLEEAEARWVALCQENPASFDGDILHVLGIHRNGSGGATVQVAPTSYRFHAIGDLGIRPLGVKGICKQNDMFLCGFRGQQVGTYPCMWEFAPSGMVEPSEPPEKVIQRELTEETTMLSTTPPIAIAILKDEEARTWEIVYQLEAIGSPQADGNEYEMLDWFDVKSLPKPMSPPAIRMKSLL